MPQTPLTSDHQNDLQTLLAKAQELLPNDPDGAEVCLNAALRILPLRGPETVSLPTSQTRLRKLIIFIDEHISETLSRDRLATVADISPSQLTRIFKARFGLGPRAYIHERRLVLAQAGLRQTDQPLAALALECGFSDQSHLGRAFRHTVGVSPARWRLDQEARLRASV